MHLTSGKVFETRDLERYARTGAQAAGQRKQLMVALRRSI
jgi:hypothetical protein